MKEVRSGEFRVDVYDIARDRTTSRVFHNEHAANSYAECIKWAFLYIPNPVTVHVEVVPFNRKESAE